MLEWSRRPVAQGIALWLLTVLLFLSVLRAGFIWNDDSFLTQNPLIHTADGLRRFWFSTEAPDYFPLTSTSLWLEWRIFGVHATGYHAINVLLHAGSVVLLWLVLRKLRVPGAWLGAAVFAVHPVNVESVAWITERKNTLSMVLFLTAAWAYLRFDDTDDSDRSRWSWYVGSLLAFALSLTAKTSTVVLPVMLLGLLAWRRRPTRKDFARLLPYFGLALVFGLVTMWFQSHRAIHTHVVRDDGLLSRTAIAARAVWFYAGKALLPMDLLFVYPRWPIGPVPWTSFVPLLGLAAMFALCLAFRRSFGRPLGFVIALYVIALLPELGFIDIYFMRYSLVSDHWQYIAMTVAAASIGAILMGAARATRAERTIPILAGLLLAAYSLTSWRQQAIYRDESSLWADTLARNPSAWIAHADLGGALLAAGRSEDAAAHFRAALEQVPEDPDLHANLAKALLVGRRFAEAAAEFEQAVRRRPDSAELHDDLGIALQGQNRMDEAIRQHREAIRLDPQSTKAYTNLGNAYFTLVRNDEAIASYREAIRVSPDDALAHNNLSATLLRVGKLDDALNEQREAVRFDPQSAPLRIALARQLRDVGRRAEAVDVYRTAVRLAPHDAHAHVELAELLCRDSRATEAAEEFELAMRAAPNDPDVMQRVGWFLATAPDRKLRDGRRALDLARRSVASLSPSAEGYATIAAASAEIGNFEDAVHWQSLAVQAAAPSDLPAQRERLDRYRKRTASDH
jgi:tetratricopeptide (TPR) repeat protein